MASRAFRLIGLPHQTFEPLFALGDDELARRGAVRRVADEQPGFPCRVSLEDAAPGEELLLLPFEHQSGASPYRASGPIFVRRGARQRELGVGEVPPYVARRLISLRAYDAAHGMVAASVCDGAAAGEEISRHFANPQVAYLHLHNARQGCYSCAAVRA